MKYFNFSIFLIIFCLISCSDKPIYFENSCSIDIINNNGHWIIDRNGEITVDLAGWVADGYSKATPESIIINIISTSGEIIKLLEGKPTVERPDVKTALNAPAMGNPGFGLANTLKAPPLGIYKIQITKIYNNKIAICYSDKTVTISN